MLSHVCESRLKLSEAFETVDELIQSTISAFFNLIYLLSRGAQILINIWNGSYKIIGSTFGRC